MLFSSTKLALLASLATLGYAAKNCEFYKGPDGGAPPFAPSVMVGLGGDDDAKVGDWDCASKWQESDTITGVEAWSSAFAIEGIKFKFASGDSTKWYGRQPNQNDIEEHQEKSWEAGEKVEIRMWGNRGQVKDKSKSNGVGRLTILKDGKELFNVGANGKGSTQSDYAQMNQGAGIVLGVKVRGKTWVSNLEFMMLKSKVVSTTLVNIAVQESLEDWNAKKKGMDKISLKNVVFVNNNQAGGNNVTYRFSNTESRDNTKTITTTRQHVFGVGVDVKVGGKASIPFLAEGSVDVTTKTHYDYTTSKSDALSESSKADLTYDIGAGAATNMLGPQRAAHCTAYATSGTFESDYTGTLEAKLEDGSKFQYTTKGHVRTVGFVDARAECKEMDKKDVPSNAEMGTTQPVQARRAMAFKA